MSEPPKVFISYSHDTVDHKRWVAELARRLRENGVDILVDQWDLRKGADALSFMQRGVRDTQRVLCICTDEYIRKADAGAGGVGYESMIVTSELVADLGSEKFIPVIRNVTSERKAPFFLSRRIYVDLSDGPDYEEQFESLLKDLHGLPPVEKPALGKNPYEKLPSDPVPPVTESRSKALPELPSELDDVANVYTKAVEIARAEDMLGWRQLLKRVRPSVERVLTEWRETYRTRPWKDPPARERAVDEAVNGLAPLFLMALAGIESGNEKFNDQRSVLDILLNLPEWDYSSGYTSITGLPATMSFVYQGLHGATCLSTGQLGLAVRLAETKVRAEDDSGVVCVWQRQDLTGSPASLGGKCREAWKYLSAATERWDWLKLPFDTVEEYRKSLIAYYMSLNLLELALLVAEGRAGHLLDDGWFQPLVALCFLASPSKVGDGALSLLVRDAKAVEEIWTHLGVARQDMENFWPLWMAVCDNWLREAYPLGSRSPLPYADLFRRL